MRLAAALLALVCFTGCAGTVVLHKEDHTAPPPPAPAPAPCYDCGKVSRDEAVQIVRVAARRQSIERLRVNEVKRTGHDWKVEGRGVDSCGHRVEVKARVDRRSGDIERFEVDSKEHRRHRNRRDDD